MTTPISTLAANVQSRLEEIPGGAGQWWSYQFEILSAIMEAQNDLLLLVGRPTQIVEIPFTLTPNSVWQSVPKGYLAITDIQGAGAPLYKVNLRDMDYLQSSWGPNWTQDTDTAAVRWAPIGFNMFAVHPAPAYGQTVLVTAIQYPATDVWPYTGAETAIFQDEFFVALELYATAYARVKEQGAEFQEGQKLMESYMQLAKRLTVIEDKRDPLLFTMGYGASQNISPNTRR